MPIEPTRTIAPDSILELGLGFWGSKALLSAVELGVFSQLAKGPLDEARLRKRLGLNERGARDFFDALVALGMLEREGSTYANTPQTDLFLDRAKPTYVGGILEMANARLYRFWGGLTDALRTGLPQSEVRDGDSFYDALYRDPRRLEEFLSAMTGLSLGVANALAEKFAWNRYRTFCDVGPAQGCVAVRLAQSHTHLTGVGFDLPVCRTIFERYVAEHGIADRVRFVAGNFLTDPLPNADVILMGHVLHGENEDAKRRLIAKAFDALPDGGALIVFEELIDEDRSRSAFALLMSLNILIETPAGFNTTGGVYCNWIRQAGFSESRIEHLVGPESMIVAVK